VPKRAVSGAKLFSADLRSFCNIRFLLVSNNDWMDGKLTLVLNSMLVSFEMKTGLFVMRLICCTRCDSNDLMFSSLRFCVSNAYVRTDVTMLS